MSGIPTTKAREQILDAMRGLAIVIMIIDHVFSLLESVGIQNIVLENSRLTVTRFSMPLFMIASGIVWYRYGLKVKRWSQVFFLALVLNAMMRLLWPDFNFPEILLLWSVLAIFWRVIVRYPIITMIVGYTQTTFWQISWQAFQPGELLIFLSAGVFLGKISLDSLWRERRTSKLIKPLAFIGRYPLRIYGGHLFLLAVIVAAVNGRFTSFL